MVSIDYYYIINVIIHLHWQINLALMLTNKTQQEQTENFLYESKDTGLHNAINFAAGVVCNAKRRDSSLPLLSKLHWLPVSFRIDFKIALTVFKIISTGQPTYLQNLINLYAPALQLRSSATNNLLFLWQKLNCTVVLSKFHLMELVPAAIKNSIHQHVSVDTFKRRLQ